ncbi:MAG: DUF1743 domain-containing protein [Candidatus Methanoliparum thermophilum]|uniref:tRNA(Ile2) 2-agmatinylcytidine synthetase TiaS n=1 Tax=Methanoliparum thermophilum TaxID=2491083 RepID=A0A520KT63_METT2|nr:tRNA(Ile)(2)-agmatinylcytidine synthase [Candidatus Methanoliparum sp. LAM-1]RZN65117.1 MAG: DUF1743 domain-containing protein [Candidatus Methanoliparum thermophilum]BDC36167.1 tRNA(Ile2) 2-agmatinylcytidine synthetase [Candidatus Methanoliparum sp. LAM-1]
MILFVGIDDTDSADKGMCTTYLVPILKERFVYYGFGDIVDKSYLIRLNPNIPFKTRGNGAICLRLSLLEEKGKNRRSIIKDIKYVVKECVEELAIFSDPKTNPGIVFIDDLKKDAIKDITDFSKSALHRIIGIDEAKKIIEEHNLDYFEYKNGRGLIGALSAIGLSLNLDKMDHTYELIAYRLSSNLDKKRRIDKQSVFYADEVTYPKTWDTVDRFNNKIVFSPAGKDPVLYGIRGDDPYAIIKASDLIISERIRSKNLFITNQGTDMHLNRESINKLKEYGSYIVYGIISEAPYDIKGGHVFFEITDGKKSVKCAAFEPTKQFRKIIRILKIGDVVEIYGGFKDDTLNIEKINLKRLNNTIHRNPICPFCGKRMDSLGKNQGFKCKKCKTHKEDRVVEKIDRGIEEGFYEVPPLARRHLSKPLVRFDNNIKKYPFR